MEKAVRLEIRGLRKVIQKREIVKDLSLDLYAGEVFGLIGPNGAGKTTTIKMLVGLSEKTAGEIRYEGLNADEHFEEIRQHVGCIVENPDLYEYLSGWDQLKLYASFYKDVDEARIREVVTLVKMDQAIHKKTKNYSLGMKQRVALALALLSKPDLLILDEPTNGLDPQGIRELRLLLRDLAETHGVTVLVSSHILGEMEALCDRVGLIHKGELLKVGRVSEIVSQMGNQDLLILTQDPEGLFRYFSERGVGVSRRQDYVRIACDRENINPLLQELMAAGFKIYGIEPDHASLEERFVEIIGEKGGEIQ